MKGRNEITMNQATMIDAVQEYLSKRMPTTPLKVESVKTSKDDRGTYSSKSEEFTVNVDCTGEAAKVL